VTDEIVIDVKNITAYQGPTLVLNNVSFSIRKNEFVYLVGKTGSGKSSLLKVLYGDLTPRSGTARVAGFDLAGLTLKKTPYLRRKLGIVFQDFQLLMDRSVNDNLRFVLKATGWSDKRKIDSRIGEVLDLVGMKTKGFKMPHELSGGEQQRVAIARALLNHPEVILADEPTGNLDPETSDEIIRLLMRISRESGTAVLITSHDYLVINKYPARTLRCEHGVINEASPATASAS
jgi:cell division transport system ATP-binding protein